VAFVALCEVTVCNLWNFNRRLCFWTANSSLTEKNLQNL